MYLILSLTKRICHITTDLCKDSKKKGISLIAACEMYAKIAVKADMAMRNSLFHKPLPDAYKETDIKIAERTFIHIRHYQCLFVHIDFENILTVDDKLLANADKRLSLLAQLILYQLLAVSQAHGEHMLRLVMQHHSGVIAVREDINHPLRLHPHQFVSVRYD